MLAALTFLAQSAAASKVSIHGGAAVLPVLVPVRNGSRGECRGDCAAEERLRRRCPKFCGSHAESLRAIAASGRAPAAGVRQSRHESMAILQSSIEELVLREGGRRSDVPVAIHDACVAAGKALLEHDVAALSALSALTAATHNSTFGQSVGYPLSVVFSYLLRFKVFRDLTGASTTMETHPVAGQIMSTLADVVSTHGYESVAARTYYASNVYTFGEKSVPLFDLGWVEQFRSIGTYTAHLGRHYYRSVPQVGGVYNASYAVHPLPPSTNASSATVRIAILADWPTGAPGAMRVLEEVAKQKPDVLIHLGDTYYSGTFAEQRDFLHDPIRAHLGEHVPVYLVPGNHDYYAKGGEGFYQIVDEFGAQEASYFTLRGATWQIVAVDTGLLNNQQLSTTLLPFLPDDQQAWATSQLEEGRRLGLKTIFMSHHQWFSRTESLGKANDRISEALTEPDRLTGVYHTNQFNINSSELPGRLANDQPPVANTRLLEQFPPSLREYVSAFYWGHEHSTAIFDRYVNITRGRLIGNGAIANPVDYDQYELNPTTVYSPWAQPPPLLDAATGRCAREGCRIGKGDVFWNLGFVTLDLDGTTATARHWELQANTTLDAEDPLSSWSDAAVYFEERY